MAQNELFRVDRLQAEEYRSSNSIAIAYLIAHFGLSAVLATTVLIFCGKLPVLVAFLAILLGYMFARGLELAHALMHGAFFRTEFPRASRLIGTILTAPFLLSWSQWRWTHFHHHRDPRIEGFDYPDVRSIVDMPKVIGHHLMLAHWRNSLRRAALAFLWPRTLREELGQMARRTEPISARLHAHVVEEYRLIAAGAVGIVIVCFLVEPQLIFYLGLAVLSASITHVLIEMPEHVLTDLDDRFPGANSFEITDSVVADVLCFNNTRHATHHRYPAIAVYRLRAASKLLEHQHCEPTYFAFWGRFARERLFVRRNRAGSG
jgi:fatty acid desaturase